MRVIAGTARRLNLKTIEGPDTRPTTDRIKETLFNMLQSEVYDCHFMDLFSGSGGIGIEALSRGAKSAAFIEQNLKAVECIRDNLQRTHLTDKADVMSFDSINGLRRLEDKGIRYDFVFMDPPYGQDLERNVFEYFTSSGLIDQNTTIILETTKDISISYLEPMGFMVMKTKEYKTNRHIFVRKKED